MSRVIASIEARMSSSRLPGKVLADINGAPALTRLVRRLRQCSLLDGIVLATSVDGADDPLEAWAATEDVPCYRGSQDDVLERVVHAQQSMDSDIVVEITGDMPLVDPDVIDLSINTFSQNSCDVVSTIWKQSYPLGIDVQVFTLADLEEVERTVSDSAVREHVSLYFYENPERYRVINLVAPEEWQEPELRLVLDYPEDLILIKEIFDRLEPTYEDNFRLPEIFHLLKSEPALKDINRHCEERSAR